MRVGCGTWSGVLAAVGMLAATICLGQMQAQRPAPGGADRRSQTLEQSGSAQPGPTGANVELQRGTDLTRQGRFREAIPHLLSARGNVANEYALEFNLSLCYLGTGEYQSAIASLEELRRKGHENADIENLLAQAYIGRGQRDESLTALERGAAISPQNEKLFAFVADACADHQDFELGVRVVDMGLRKLPQSARLHYERAMFLTQLDQFDRAKEDFVLATKLGQGSEIGYLAAGNQELLEGNVPEALRIAREGVSKGVQNSALLVVLGKALLRSGITPGQPEFEEAKNALEKAVAEHPNDAASQIALGQLYLLCGRFDDAIAQLESARQMRPDQASIYAPLAKAYQRKGDSQHAQEALAKLQALNEAQAERIRSAPGERKMSYGGGAPGPQ